MNLKTEFFCLFGSGCELSQISPHHTSCSLLPASAVFGMSNVQQTKFSLSSISLVPDVRRPLPEYHLARERTGGCLLPATECNMRRFRYEIQIQRGDHCCSLADKLAGRPPQEQLSTQLTSVPQAREPDNRQASKHTHTMSVIDRYLPWSYGAVRSGAHARNA